MHIAYYGYVCVFSYIGFANLGKNFNSQYTVQVVGRVIDPHSRLEGKVEHTWRAAVCTEAKNPAMKNMAKYVHCVVALKEMIMTAYNLDKEGFKQRFGKKQAPKVEKLLGVCTFTFSDVQKRTDVQSFTR